MGWGVDRGSLGQGARPRLAGVELKDYMRKSITLEGLGDDLRIESLFDGQLWRVRLNRPNGNVLDSEMTSGLTTVFEEARHSPDLKLITIEGEGKHFSYGASIEEHMPDKCARMLTEFHRMFDRLHASQVQCHAIVRGQCLGGGLELAAFCHRVYAAPRSSLGQPEISLGVFAPVASIILGDRIGRGNAEDLCLSGRVIDAQEALGMGLVDVVAEDPWEACKDYFAEHVESHSASSLRFAVRAIRLDFGREFERRVREMEHLYLKGLMETQDAPEGILAFIEKRAPLWRNE
ncbi:MAG: cyclohexa-1,5-dienecarbonyl-CoA hydratase [Planctomycetota bacterium]|jgi:cyclohexa-1,5-dienecarbonyl-CoA hydratase